MLGVMRLPKNANKTEHINSVGLHKQKAVMSYYGLAFSLCMN